MEVIEKYIGYVLYVNMGKMVNGTFHQTIEQHQVDMGVPGVGITGLN